MFGFLLVLLAFPAALWFLHIEDGLLYGEERTNPPENRTWWNGQVQASISSRFEKTFVGKSAAVKTNNQLLYSTLGVSNSKEVLAGKNGEFFHKGFFRKQSQNQRWKTELPNTFKNLEIISDYLDSKGKQLWIVLAPEKASYMPNELPWYVSKKAVENRPYLNFAEMLKNTRLRYTDLSEFSRRPDAEARGRVFPKAGMHWSDLEAAMGFKKWIEELNEETGWQLPETTIERVESTSDPLKQELDLWELSHLWLLPDLEPAPIPIIKDTQPAAVRVLGVGDSFYFTWEALGLVEQTFEKSEYWFYNQELMNRQGSREFMEEFEVLEKLEEYDLIVLMAHEGNILGIPFGFDIVVKQELIKRERKKQ